MTASANHKNQKVVPILVSYFNEVPGNNVKVLGLDVLPGATSDQLNNYTFSALSTAQVDKMISMSADSININFRHGKFYQFKDFFPNN